MIYILQHITNKHKSNTNVKLSKGIFLNHYIFTKIVINFQIKK